MKIIYLEGKPDKTLIRFLGIPKKQVRDCGGKSRVCKQLEKASSLSIGLIDEDPNSIGNIRYLSNFKEIANKFGIRLLEHKVTGQRIIVLCPRIEEWLIMIAESSNISMRGLCNPGENLKDHINSRIPQLEKFLNKLLEAKSPELLYLKKLIR